jgi:hypothetical protein
LQQSVQEFKKLLESCTAASREDHLQPLLKNLCRFKWTVQAQAEVSPPPAGQRAQALAPGAVVYKLFEDKLLNLIFLGTTTATHFIVQAFETCIKFQAL